MDHLLHQSRQPPEKPGFTRPFLLPSFLLVLLFTSQAAVPFTSLPGPASLTARSQPASQPLTSLPDPVVQAMLNQVQSSTLAAYVSGLSGQTSVTIGGAPFTLVTRSSTSTGTIQKATQYVYEHFQALGLAASYAPWQSSGIQGRNVVADQPGSDPTCLYLLTAHLDDTSASPNSLAPGADDNASGVAGVLVAARILSQSHFICSLRYVLFTGEEQGLLGSDVYAQAAAQRGDPIQGVLNLDMIAYNTPGSPATIEMDIRSGLAGNPDRVLTTLVTGVIQAYQLDLTPLVYALDDDGSDQYSFWTAGFPAVEVIEDWDDHSPYYHQTSDTLSTLNLPYFTRYVKAMVGAMAHLAKIAPLPFHIFLPLLKQ